jgi:hypothetical protein
VKSVALWSAKKKKLIKRLRSAASGNYVAKNNLSDALQFDTVD